MSDIAYVLFGGLTDIAAIVLILWGIMNIPFTKNRKVLIPTGIITVILLMVDGAFKENNADAVMIISTCIVLLSVCFIFQCNFFKLIAFTLLAYVLALFLDSCIVGIYSAIDIYNYSAFMIYLNSLTMNFILGLIVLIKRKKKPTLQIHISKKIYALLFAGAGTGAMIIAGLLIEANSRTGERARHIIIFITVIVALSYCTACIMMVFITESRDSYKALSQINQKVIEAQQQYYTLVNEKQQEIRSLRHEMKNHLACIHGLYRADKLPEMEQYINQLIELSQVSTDLFDTGNDIVNAILNEMQSRYKKEHIAIRLEGGFPSQLYIAPMDLCIMIANVISNAVEAIQRMNRQEDDFHYVDVKISSFKNDLYISVKNPVDKNINIVNGIPVTSKKDRSVHGFGIKNVIQVAEKYQGSYSYRIENDQFCVEINIKNTIQ